jgi:hypothetical protein
LTRAYGGIWRSQSFAFQAPGDLNKTCHAYNIFNWLLKKTLGLDLNDIKEWLGFIFEWESILTTHRVFANVAKQTFEYGEAQINNLERMADEFFDKLIEIARTTKPIEGDAGRKIVKLECKSDNIESKLPPQARSGFQFLTKSPAAGLGNYQLLHGGAGKAAPTEEILSSFSEMESFVTDVLEPFLKENAATIKMLGEEIDKVFKNGNMTVNDAIAVLGSAAVVGVLRTLKTFFKSILKIVRVIFKAIREVLFAKWPDSFLTAFYKKITGRTEMTSLDVVLLLFAIPATVVYKILTRKAPFASGTGGLDTAGHEELFRMFRETSLMASDDPKSIPLKDYLHVSGISNSLVQVFKGSADVVATLAGRKLDPGVGVVVSLYNVILTIPIGNWNSLTVGGWAANWAVLGRSVYDATSFAVPHVSGGVQIVTALLRLPVDIARFAVDLSRGLWQLAIWRGCEDLASLIANGAAGLGKGVDHPKLKVALAGTAGIAVALRGASGIGRNIYMIVVPG